MINFLNMIRLPAQMPPAGQSAGTPSPVNGEPLGLFAVIVGKLLGDLAGVGATVPDKQIAEPAIMDGEPRPVKPRTKEGAENAQAVVLVPLSAMIQVANLMPVQAPGSDVAAPLTEAAAAGGSPESSRAPIPLSFAEQFSPVENDGELLLSLLHNAPPAAGPSQAARLSVSPLVQENPVDVGLPVQPAKDADVELTVLPANDNEKSGVTAPVPNLPGAQKSPVADLASWFKSELKVVTPEPTPAPAAVTGNVSDPPVSRAPQTQSQSPAPVVAFQTPPAVIENVDPAVILRAAPLQPRKPVEAPSRVSNDSQEPENVTVSEDAPAKVTGFFSGIIRDVFGAVTKPAGKQSPADSQGGSPASLPVVKSAVSPDEPASPYPDVQAQAAKKTPGTTPQDSAPAVDVTRPAHEQVDLSAVRSSQAALGMAGLEKTDTATTASPLRELPAAYAPLPPEVSRRIADQVIQNFKLQVDGTTSDIRMTLKPPSLGEVQLTIHVEDSRMQAQIDVSQQVVKAALEAHMPQLRQALQEHGIEVQRIDVMLPESSLQRDGSGAGGERTGRRGGSRRQLNVDDAVAFQGAKDMGYNTIELIM